MAPSQLQLRVPDMRCEGCAERVARVLERIEGVRSADVSLEDKIATVEVVDGAVEIDDLTAAVEKAGYSPEPA